MSFEAIAFGLILILVYFTVYILNRRTPIPEECRDAIEISEKCASCKISSCGAKQRMVK